MLPESTTIIEYLDGLASRGSGLIPTDAASALQARFWDRFHDHYIANPMQKIVGDTLRPEGCEDPEGVAEARRTLDTAYPVLDAQLRRERLDGGRGVHDGRLRGGAGALLCPRRAPLG